MKNANTSAVRRKLKQGAHKYHMHQAKELLLTLGYKENADGTFSQQTGEKRRIARALLRAQGY